MNNYKILLTIAIVFFITSCNQDKPKLVKVSGKITFNGQPLTAGSINFHPASTNTFTKDNPSSILQEDGSFTMKTFPYGNGVSPGEYKITLAPQLASRISLPNLAYPEKTNAKITIPETGLENFTLDIGTLKIK
ncbi:MAG: hypothetical protein NTV50_12790 [Planctomycetota bacterium]|nr:hypothetical protein [Planctomycetota bacterium]